MADTLEDPIPVSSDGRVAVYIDFDNIVISRYDEVHGRGDFQRDRQRAASGSLSEAEFAQKLEAATVDALLARGVTPAVYRSVNLPDGFARNDQAERRYRERWI